ncbi:hypothetical protein K457DRAFT_128073 [Linnemannia elongata AG-77]|uniref:Late embryogenesis abundant protein LEA-2 subgroup domain-containing protein n=1 Tax=Linnemannia elongata AG-77 TaxID=1314771 RepID=A0A197JQJ5_9FUNG|nr:hypothetical protein K457DRAFT_128073 [Linnemannia elongata AG-77]
MKSIHIPFVLGIAAFAVNVNAVPMFSKRATTFAASASCVAAYVITGSQTGTCKADMAADVGAVESITLDSLFLDFTGPDPLTAKISSKGLKVQLARVPGPVTPSFPITGTREMDNTVDIATFSTPWSSATVDSKNLLTTMVEECALKIIPGQQVAFSKFITSVIMSSTTQEFDVKGLVDANFTLSLFPFGQKLTTLPGIGFSSKNVVGRRITDNSWDANKMFLFNFEVKFTNPSQVSIAMGDLSFNMVTGTEASRVDLGVSVVKDARLTPGDNLWQLTTTVNGGDEMTFLNALKGNGNMVVLEGFGGSSKNKVIADAFAPVKIQLTLAL